MFGTSRRRVGVERASPVGHKTVAAAARSAASKQQRAGPLLPDGRGDFTPRAGNGAIDEASGGRCGDARGAAAAAGDAGKPFLSEAVFRGLAYGTVNGILLSPVSVSFCAMIFRDPAFIPYLPRLVKLVMFSGAVHMACFGSLSSLKFAAGSVQDAGLIFLSAIASSVVVFSREEGLDEAGMLSTACFILSTCTGLLGVALVVLGRLRLASVVQYLPMPVIGGYLAFIGYFCGQAGLAFAAGCEMSSIRDLGVLANAESLLLVLPSIFGGTVMYLCLRRYPSPMTLPLLMAAFLATFFVFLWSSGTTLEEARAAGWVSAASPMLPLPRAWDYFSFADVRWEAFVRVTPNLFAMIVVVAFSSCLDVAAIEMEMGTPLDFNRELQTVGWSNVVSGLLGGFTGSYIFSQTIFNLRAGVDTRLASATSTVIMLGMAASPVSVISFLPRCFFGSLLVLISVDLMVEWLWQARVRMMNAEYLVCLATFAAIQAWGVEGGMLAGLVLAALSFTITYAQVPTVMTARVKTSTVMRTFEERVILKAHQEQTVVLELQGYIFFGSAVKILSEVKDRIVWGTDQPDPLNAAAGTGGVFGSVPDGSGYAAKNPDHPQREQQLEAAGVLDAASGGGASMTPRRDVAMSPVFNRSGAVYPSSSFSSASRGSVLPPESSPLSRRNPLRAQSWTRREHANQQLREDPADAGSAPRGRSMAYPLARTRSVGGAAGSAAVASITGSTGGRPFHGSSMSAAASAEDEQAPLVTATTNSHPGKRRKATDGITADETRASAGTSVSGQRDYGAMEEGEAGDGGRGGDGGGGVAILGEGVKRPRGAIAGGESGSAPGALAACEGPVQAYMSLWANGGSFTDNRGGDQGALGGGSPRLSGNVGGGSPVFLGRAGRSASMVSLLPASEQRTRRVILDFSNVVGVDATAARSCFLMLKIILRNSGADVVFSGVSLKVQALLRSHGVITDSDPVFNSLDTALEWSEEVMLQERRDDIILRRAAGGAAAGGTASTTTTGSSPSLPSLRQHRYFAGAVLSPLVLGNLENQERSPGGGGGVTPTASEDGEAVRAARAGDEDEGNDEEEEEEEEERRPAASSEDAETVAFLGDHEDYYFRAGTLRRQSSMHHWISDRAGDNPLVVGDVGSLQSILEDYLEIDRFQAPEGVSSVLGEARSFFRQEHVSAGAVLADNKSAHAPEKLYFIGAGSVELQIPGASGPRRLQKVCAGGTFGEMGFFLRTPQAFRAVAREPCHLHTLDRAGMAAMQRQNPGLCILVQKALMKSICLAASLSIESAHMGPVDDGRAGLLGRIEEEL